MTNAYREKLLSLQFAPSAMPSRRDGAHCAIAKAGDKKLSKDLESYKRMAESGLRPKSLENAAEIESRCESSFEVERGMSAADMAKTTPSFKRGDSDAQRDVAKGAPEFRRRALEAVEHFAKQDPTRPGEITS
jgi:hypothetical protein